MPELPEVEALARFLSERARGKRLRRCELVSIAALKTFEPPLEALLGKTLEEVSRLGKYLCLRFEQPWLVVHLARAGWLRWYEELPAAKPRPGRGPLAMRLGLEDGSGWDLTEAGTEKRLAIWVVGDPQAVEGVAELGVDPLSAEFDVERLRKLLASEPGTIKNALTHQSLIAGVGNAYSDEALHAARLSPFKPARSLDPDELERLHQAVVGVLTRATLERSGLAAGELKSEKRRSMAVHGRTGQPCPICADTIREVSYSTKSLQYCPTCQTKGRQLADRRRSRLLK